MCKMGAARGTKEGKKSAACGRERGREGRGGHGVVSGAEGGGVHGTPCAAFVAARVSHGHGVHCPEPRPQGHRPTEPIVPLLCSSTHFRRVLLLAMRVPPSPSTCIMRVDARPLLGGCKRVYTFSRKTRDH